MKYLITIYNTPEATAAIEASDEQRRNHDDLQREMRQSGELVDTNVGSTTDAWVVRAVDGRRDIESGPYRHGDEIAGGYYIVDCDGDDRALDIASRFFEASYVPIEVRRLLA